MAYMIILTVDKISLVLEIFEDFLTKCCRLCRRKYNGRKSRRQSRKFQPLSSSATSESFFSCSKSGSDPSYQKEESEGNVDSIFYSEFSLNFSYDSPDLHGILFTENISSKSTDS